MSKFEDRFVFYIKTIKSLFYGLSNFKLINNKKDVLRKCAYHFISNNNSNVVEWIQFRMNVIIRFCIVSYAPVQFNKLWDLIPRDFISQHFTNVSSWIHQTNFHLRLLFAHLSHSNQVSFASSCWESPYRWVLHYASMTRIHGQ